MSDFSNSALPYTKNPEMKFVREQDSKSSSDEMSYYDTPHVRITHD